MTPPAIRSGRFNMGTVCSSNNKSRGKKSKHRRASQTSSSEVALEVNRSHHQRERPSTAEKPTPSLLQMVASATAQEGDSLAQRMGQSNTTVEASRDWTERSRSERCLVPPQLSRLPEEMQNLLMGRWPVPPTPDSRIIRIFLAAEEADSRTERMWLTKKVFPGLRSFTEKLGFHLHIVDTLSLLPSISLPQADIRDITKSVMNSNIDVWVIFLNNKLGWRLPSTIDAEVFIDLLSRLDQQDHEAAVYMNSYYRLDENSVPPVYALLPDDPEDSHEENRLQVFDQLCSIMTKEQEEQYMTEGLHEEVATALSNHAGMSDNILVVRRNITKFPTDLKPAVSSQFMDVTFSGETHHVLADKLRVLAIRVERIVSNGCILKFSPCWFELQKSQSGTETSYVANLCQKVEEKMRAAVSRMVERQASVNPYLAAGLPPVLCQELLMHAHKQQKQLHAGNVTPSTIVQAALTRLRAEPRTPLILHGPVGVGLQTIAAFLAREEAHDSSRMVALRFMTLTPESQTVMAALVTVLEQVTIGMGGVKAFHALLDLSCASLLSAMTMATAKNPVTIIICGLQWKMLGQNKDTLWLMQELPPHVRLVVLSSCQHLHKELEGELNTDHRCMQIPPMKVEQVAQIFLTRLSWEHRRVTNTQHKAVMTVLRATPLPVMAVLLAYVALEWHSDTRVSQGDLPKTLEEAFICLFQQAERVVGRCCVKHVLSYISIARFGLSDSELEDLLAIDDQLMSSLYPDTLPFVRRCPTSLWLYLKRKFRYLLDTAYVYGHAVHRWQKPTTPELVLDHYNVKPERFHCLLTQYFSGVWADQPKPLPDPSQDGTPVPVWCSVLEQPNSYSRQINCRKFLCLLHHMLQSLPSDDAQPGTEVCLERKVAAKKHLLNLRWLVVKLDATSLVQLLDDIQMAINAAANMSLELSWLQLLVATSATMLNVSGRQLHTRLHAQILKDHGKTPSSEECDNNDKRVSFCKAMNQMESSVAKSSVPFLIFEEVVDSSSVSTSESSSSAESNTVNGRVLGDSPPEPPPCLNGLYAHGKDGRRVLSISAMAGEIIVWDTEVKRAEKTLHNINSPRHLVFLDSDHVVVLCNRELKAYDLNTGSCVSNIRGMLNLRMPYFHVRDANTVIVMARNRMSVNVQDVRSGQIYATFKAGEDRFLDSLLVSGNGNILVCGDETQKPFPLLVWELTQSKLLHDLRMPQHEFITSIADITYEGTYVACACRGVYDVAYNFMVVYELTSGQLYRQFRMAASVTAVCVASGKLSVVMTLNDGNLVSYDIQTGLCNFNADGVKAVYNKIQLSPDEAIAVTYSINAGSMPIACTVALWDLAKGCFMASYTFDSEVTCCLYVAHNNSILVGLTSCRHYAVLTLFDKHFLHSSSADENSDISLSDKPLWRLV